MDQVEADGGMLDRLRQERGACRASLAEGAVETGDAGDAERTIRRGIDRSFLVVSREGDELEAGAGADHQAAGLIGGGRKRQWRHPRLRDQRNHGEPDDDRTMSLKVHHAASYRFASDYDRR